MPHLDYSEKGVITLCNPTIKRAENKPVSAVIGMIDAAINLICNVYGN